uniref:DUF4371 domain-containing protein n=1 Tax=Panagrolaimus superbus TaxID=310955 RepID=A0A914ZD16_9BILA
MAPISPGLPNNCDVAFKFIIGDIAAEVENADENLNIVEENNEDNTEPPSKKQKVSAIDREVEMVDLSSGPEYDEVDEKIAAFVRRINEDVTANLNDFQERLFKRFGAEAATCAAEAQAAQPKIMPWNDRSHWGIREDRIIEQAFDGKLKITHEQKCWLEILVTEDPHNPRFRCRICRKHMQRNEKLIKKLRLGMLAEENGAEYPLTSLDSKANFWRKKLRNHCRPDRSHAQIIVGIKDAVFNGQKQCLQQSEKALSQETSIASKVFRTAYVVVKRHISFRIFPDLIKLQQLNGALPAAVSHGNRRSFGRIIGVIARSLRNSLIYTLKTFQPPVSIILDASSDSQNRQFLMVYIQFAHELKPEVRLYKVFEIQSETAAAMKEVILEQFKLDGIYEIMKKKLIGFMSDSAAVRTGWKTGLGTIFNQWVKESDTGCSSVATISWYCYE